MATRDGKGLPGDQDGSRADRQVQIGGLRVYEDVHARGEPEDDGSMKSELWKFFQKVAGGREHTKLEKFVINGDVDRSECSCGAMADSVNGRLTRVCRCIGGTGILTFKYPHGASCFRALITTHSSLHRDGYEPGSFDDEGVIKFCETCTVFSKKVRITRKTVSPSKRLFTARGGDNGSTNSEIVMEDDRVDAVEVLLNGLLGGHKQRTIEALKSSIENQEHAKAQEVITRDLIDALDDFDDVDKNQVVSDFQYGWEAIMKVAPSQCMDEARAVLEAVSYTHLTLPTKA